MLLLVSPFSHHLPAPSIPAIPHTRQDSLHQDTLWDKQYPIAINKDFYYKYNFSSLNRTKMVLFLFGKLLL